MSEEVKGKPSVEPDGVDGWCLRCEMPCFLLADTCRGCAGPAIDAPMVLLAAWSQEHRRANLLQKFKDYVHARLDAAGIATDPDSPHKAEGCRIGGRLDEVLGELATLRQLCADMTKALESSIVHRHDLLAACKAFEAYYERGELSSFPVLKAHIRAAIAKAEGGAKPTEGAACPSQRPCE